MAQYIRWMQEAGAEPFGDAGEEIRTLHLLRQEEFPVPQGFVVLPSAYERLARELDLQGQGTAALGRPERLSRERIETGLEALRNRVAQAETAPDLLQELRDAFHRLVEETGQGGCGLAVCPFVLPEVPGGGAGSPGPVYLPDVSDPAPMVAAVRRAWASVWSGECFQRCADAGLDPFGLGVSVWVRRLVRARVGGICLPRREPESGKQEMVVDACWGMAEAVFRDGFDADRFVLQDAPLVLLEQNVGSKERRLVPHPEGTAGLREEAVPEEMAEMPCLGWEQIQEIAETGRAVQRVSGRRREMHWAYENGDLFVLRVPALSEPHPPADRPREAAAGPEAPAPEAREQGAAGALPPEVPAPGGSVSEPQDRAAPRQERSAARAELPAAPPAGGPGEPAADEWGPRPSALAFPSKERYPGWRLSLAQRARAELLASLFRSVRKRKGQGGALRERDEFSHRHTGSRYWNESYYFNFFDPALKIGGFSRIGMVPNQDMVIGILYLFLPDGGILMLTQTEPCRASRDRVSAGQLHYERVEPLWSWRIRFEGSMLHLDDPARLPALVEASSETVADQELAFRQASVDLRFRGWSPCHDFKGADPRFVAERFVAAGSRVRDLRAVSQVASEHYEQVGGWQGSVVLDGRGMELNGSGHRDHSWGDRDWKAPAQWTWLTAQFGGAFGFNLSRVVIRSLDIYNGYVCRSGKNVPLRRAWLDTEFEPDGVTQKRVLLRIQDAEGWEADIEGRPRTVVPLLLRDGDHRTLVNEAFTAYRWEGRTGYGISEYLHQLG